MSKLQITSTPNFSDILLLRKLVLRPNVEALSQCEFPGDFTPGNFHVGAFIGEKIVSIASFHKEDFSNPLSNRSYRLRGMATHPDFLRLGIGSKILYFGIEELRKKNCDLLWFNARTAAVPFYTSLGFHINSDEFEIPNTGPHYLMYKNIS